ncbi:hypothetical protein GGX14DRAFT_657713 [Mycena pura]|uniref:Uncharacterized protein n=1 Tax=Mycena pura TaxID=153505 RepID=A0AAD6YM46_9AGAR|nr:hypothetical protein GGX14DRAFT_657713 [Mycena pura]
MSTPSMRRPQVSLSPRAFTRLASTLNVSNAHYRAVAASARAVANTTHHARKRARRLGLVVDIARAVGCPESLVALVPLPVIDRSVAPAHRRTTNRPALRLDMPRDAPANCNDSALLRSTCSAQDAAPAALTAAPSAGKLSCNVYKDPSYLVPSRRAPEPPVVPLDVELADDVFDGLELGYPASAAVDSSSSSLPSSSAFSRSRSSSSSDSSGPHTPADVEVVVVSGLVSPMKRKCIVMDLDDEPVEKRLKYARKDWVRNPRKLCELGAARSEANRHFSHRVACSS